MTVDQLLKDLEANGVELWFEADRLRFRAPQGALSPDLREVLSARKHEIVAALRSSAERQHVVSPLSYNQRSLYFLHQAAPASPAYNLGFALRIKSRVNLAALQNALQALVDRHDVLRTTIDSTGGEIVQRVHGTAPVSFELRALPGATEQELSTRVHEACAVPFDLQRGPVFRAHLFSLCETDHVLLIAAHHSAIDGWSTWMLLDELKALYAAQSSGRASALPRPAATYLDYVRSQQQMLTSARGDTLWEYWREQLRGDLTPLELPADRPRPNVMRYVGSSIAVSWPEDLTAAVKHLAREQGSTLFAVLLAAYQAFLARYTGRPDILVGTPVLGRDEARFQSVVGYFVNSVVLRSQVDPEVTFTDFLARVRGRVLDAVAKGDYPFALLVKQLGVRPDASRPPVFQTMFMLQQQQRGADASALVHAGSTPLDFGGLLVELYPLTQQEGQVDLTLDLMDFDGRLSGSFKYNTEIFDATSVERMREHFETFVRAIVAAPERKVSALDLLDADQRRELLFSFNDTHVPVKDEDEAVRRFEGHVLRHPNAPAVRVEGQELTYAALNTRANQIAHRLQRLGARPGVLVGLGLSRSRDLLPAMLGVLKSGAAYVPMDPAFPPQRLAWMIEDASPAIIITEEALKAVWPASDAVLLLLDDSRAELELEASGNPTQTARPEDLAYVIFTSGSTGRPKGVEIPRLAVNNFLASMAREPGILSADRLLAVTTLSFDIAVLELLLPLTVGATVVLASREDALDGNRLQRLIEQEGITMMQATPATWRLMRDAGWAGSRGLKVLVGGEPLPPDLALALVERAGEVWNMYGPTETTVWSTVARVVRGERIDIGRPIANTRTYVLGPDLQPVPVGVTGELWIAGAGLARGYHKRPELTTERFLADPYVPTERMYRTGDLARMLAGGRLEHLGRIDAQVKVRGFRIELGEIEAALNDMACVQDAAVVPVTHSDGDTRLIACVIAAKTEGHETAGATEIRRALQDRLPDYMVPATILFVESFPRTSNGKLDRRELAAHADMLARQSAASPGAVAASERALSGGWFETPVEEMLAAIWADALQVGHVRSTDDFFELGGHSLLAARLMQQLNEIFSIDLPLSTLFETPTVAGMAAIILATLDAKPVRHPNGDARVVEINGAGARPPFFFMHAALQGNGFYCYNLGRHIGDDQPIYALGPIGLDGGPIPQTVEEAAAIQLDSIKAIQPHGPYYLGGFCGSGAVALEVARALQAEGERVELVVTIETRVHPPILLNRLANGLAALVAKGARLSVRQQLKLAAGLRPAVYSLARFYHDAAKTYFDHAGGARRFAGSLARRLIRGLFSRQEAPSAVPPAPAGGASARAAVMRANYLAVDGYVPRPYNGSILCMWAEAEPFEPLMWKLVSSHVELQPVAGNHNTCVTTQIDSLAQLLKAALRKAQARAAAAAPPGPGTVLPHRGAEKPVAARRKSVARPQHAAMGSLRPNF